MSLLRSLALRACRRVMEDRPPDLVIGQEYVYRWHLLPQNRFLNLYLHVYHGSDEDRALHDHPWVSLSWMLRGALWEVDEAHPYGRIIREGQWRLRRARYAHRLELLGNPTITLFLTGPWLRVWGFHCPQGWRPWFRFVDPDNPGQVGRGCD